MLNPLDYGYPVTRMRQFMLAHRFCKLYLRISCHAESMRTLFHRRCMVDARVFFKAPQSAVSRAYDHLAVARFLPTGDWGIEGLLAPGRLKRLKAYQRLAAQDNKSFVIVDLNQHATFWRRPSAVCPALLRKNFLFAITFMPGRRAVNRPMLTCEKLAVQGLPILLPRNHYLVELLPRRLQFGRLSRAEARLGTDNPIELMAGNGQHMACLGSVLFIVLVGFEVQTCVDVG